MEPLNKKSRRQPNAFVSSALEDLVLKIFIFSSLKSILKYLFSKLYFLFYSILLFSI